jgi:1,4-alpha-glucan branching enzyme
LHAYHFIKSIESLINKYQHATEKQAILCLPFDTELFGHWWFEGPRFLNAVIRGIYHSPFISLEKCSTIINDNHQSDIASLPEGSWGEHGNHDVWINPQTKWTWEKIYDAECTFSQLMDTYHKDNRSKIQERLLLQAMRELMLMQSSDWQFLITNASAKDYAEMRFSNHYSDFNILTNLITKYEKSKRLLAADAKIIQQIEVRNAVFPELKLDMWSD